MVNSRVTMSWTGNSTRGARMPTKASCPPRRKQPTANCTVGAMPTASTATPIVAMAPPKRRSWQVRVLRFLDLALEKLHHVKPTLWHIEPKGEKPWYLTAEGKPGRVHYRNMQGGTADA